MDFFLNDIAHWISGDDRLNDADYIPWSEKDFRFFLEKRCFLSLTNPIKGRIITNHHEAFFFWDELINKKDLQAPFEVTHIDAHSDMGLGDSGYVYITKELMNHPMQKRRSMLNDAKVYMGNYLSYALACGWIRKIDFVFHDLWDDDFMNIHLKNFDARERYFQFKGYDKTIDVGMQYSSILDGQIKPSYIDPDIPFNVITCNEFENSKEYDYLVFCQSPGYTPKTADYMLEIIKEYIIEV